MYCNFGDYFMDVAIVPYSLSYKISIEYICVEESRRAKKLFTQAPWPD